mmetsp:Transcript_28121/g.39552  ORF Transcript_28121/g.39552 Transcript_28121/m.39552 type:complete len:278 (+) Transcript_28121:80-913(+)
MTSTEPNEVDRSCRADQNIQAEDQGHRFGNFHNYYQFNPPLNRLELLEPVFQYLKQTSHRKRRRTEEQKEKANDDSFLYCDIGCNEGDLTIEMSKALHEKLCKPVDFVGFDIDPLLIERAEKKWKDKENKIVGTFKVGNAEKLNMPDRGVDMISLFSTTMWIHVHGGDVGLREALRRICNCSRQFVLIEPQPSKCYRNAMIRLRKMGRTELDVSNDRLKLRQNIEEEIDKIMNSNCFFRVQMDENDNGKSDPERTKWNRALQLYERSTDQGTENREN